jgi:hypothetical protein
MSLLSEMEMIGENAKNIWEEEVDIMEKDDQRDVMETLPANLLVAVQELARDEQKADMPMTDIH